MIETVARFDKELGQFLTPAQEETVKKLRAGELENLPDNFQVNMDGTIHDLS